jgi:hypothetical protein
MNSLISSELAGICDVPIIVQLCDVQKECMKDLNDGVLLVYRFLGSASDCS